MCLDEIKLRRIADKLVEVARDIYALCDESGVRPKQERAIDWWCAAYKERFGRDYIVTNYSIAGKNLKTLREKLGEEKFKEVCLAYFGSEDPWAVQNAHSIEALPSMVNKLLAKKDGSLDPSPAELLARKHRDHRR